MWDLENNKERNGCDTLVCGEYRKRYSTGISLSFTYKEEGGCLVLPQVH